MEIFVIPDIKSERPNTHNQNWLLDQLDSLMNLDRKQDQRKWRLYCFFHFINYESLLKKRTPAIVKEI